MIGLVVAICFVYLGYRLNKIISPPALLVETPAMNLITKQTSWLIAGKTEAEASLVVNGENVLSDKNGNFSKLIHLKNGLNFIEVTARKKYGRSRVITRQILVKE